MAKDQVFYPQVQESSATSTSSSEVSNFTKDTFSGDGSTTAFTLSVIPSSINNTNVFVGGVYQEKSTYSLSSQTLTFSTAPPSGVSIEVQSVTATTTSSPSAGSVDRAALNLSSAFPTPVITYYPTAGSATHTPTAGCRWIRFIVQAGGGGGGGSGTTPGTGGTGGTSSVTPSGGSAIISCTGGTGGGNFAARGTGGTATLSGVSGIKINGASGTGGTQSAVASNDPSGGAGGSSPFGGAGGGGRGSGGGGEAGSAASANSGSGGGGAGGDSAKNSGGGGGAGAYANVVVTSIATSYSIVVGDKGAGGTLGTGGLAGGAGGTGQVIVEEYFQ